MTYDGAVTRFDPIAKPRRDRQSSNWHAGIYMSLAMNPALLTLRFWRNAMRGDVDRCAQRMRKRGWVK